MQYVPPMVPTTQTHICYYGDMVNNNIAAATVQKQMINLPTFTSYTLYNLCETKYKIISQIVL